MILDELFEAMKPSDIPTYLRRQQGKPDLTPQDIEKERSPGAFRFLVGDQQFMDQRSAQEYARSTGQTVSPINPQPQGNQPQPTHRVVDPRPNRPTATFKDQASAQKYAATVNGRVEPIKPVSETQINEQEIDIPAAMNAANRGALILTALQKDKEFARMSRRPLRFNMAGEQFLIYDPDVKNSILGMALSYKKRGALDQFMLNLGQPESLRMLLSNFESDQAAGTPGQAGGPRSARHAREDREVKKKTDLEEKSIGGAGTSARTQRMVARIRARQPQATSDIEALAYDVEAQRKRDTQEINKLEKEIDDLEGDIRQDLQQTVKQLRGRKGTSGALAKQVQVTDKAQSDAIKRILKVNQDQQSAIDDLEQSITSVVAKGSTTDTSFPAVSVKSAQPTTTAEPAKKPATRAKKSTRAAKAPALPLDAPELEIPPAPAPAPAVSPEPTQTAKSQPQSIPTAQVLKFKRRGPQGVLPLDTEEPFQPQSRTGTLGEAKKKPTPTNPDLWSRAKSAARSKFDVYPSAYANAWAAKWYKSKGGGWRMGKGSKK